LFSYLQADAYPGYDALYKTGRVQEVASWAHARRYTAYRATHLPGENGADVGYITTVGGRL